MSAQRRGPDGNGNRPHILVVECEGGTLTAVLDQHGYSVASAACGTGANDVLDREIFDAVVVDTCSPGEEGLRTVRHAHDVQPDTAVVVTTEWGTVESAVSAMRLGATDYVPQPVSAEQLLLVIERALDRSHTSRELAALRRRVTRDIGMVGRSPAMEAVFDKIERVAPTRTRILITGETGTGKEMTARAIHRLSTRRRSAFVPVNCAQFASTVLESELFGHTKGSFTGAIASRRGLFEEAAGGTLFLDEVSSISLDVQVKLLRVLQDRSIQRVGSNDLIPVDFRLIAATNANLEARMRQGSFREDLFYRLNVYPIRMPALRERKTDIPLLAIHFSRRFAKENEVDRPHITDAAMDRLIRYDWPGNVRQLENSIERAVVTSSASGTIHADSIALPHSDDGVNPWESALVENWSLGQLERKYIQEVLRLSDGNKNRAASVLGIDRRTLYRKLRRYEADEADAASRIV